MMFRVAGKFARELWGVIVIILFVCADTSGAFDGTWIGVASDFATILIFAWLVLFAIGVSRGEPNP